MMLIVRFILAFCVTVLIGKLVSKLKLPAILGWLIGGMMLGPYAFALINNDLLSSPIYEKIINILECSVGLMIGTELIWNRIKKAGKQIVVTTFTQSIGTFILVSLVFGTVFYFMNIPIYLAFIFGGIALATAPAPALSIVKEFKTKGPVTNTLIPMAALDDMVGVIVFFTVMAIVSSSLSTQKLPIYMIVLVVLLPLIIGAIIGFGSGMIMRKFSGGRELLLNVICSILVISFVGILVNDFVLPKPILNFMLMGMSYSMVFSNMISEENVEKVMNSFNPILNVSIIIVIMNLGAPLDFHLIFGAGLFTFIYIISRACGKYFGARFGATITHAPETVKKYLGFTLLPHSGVSLVFTGIAVSSLTVSAPHNAQIIQGTIAAAAVINEVIAVIVAKKGFEWANEIECIVDEEQDDEEKVIVSNE